MTYLFQGLNTAKKPIHIKVTPNGTWVSTKPNLEHWIGVWRDVSDPEQAINELERLGNSNFQKVNLDEPAIFTANGKRYHLVCTRTNEPVKKAQMLDHHYAMNMAFNSQIKGNRGQLFWKLEELK